MKTKRFFLWTNLLLLAILPVLSGCQNTGKATAYTGKKLPSVAVLPFENLSGEPNAGLIIMNDLNSALSNSTSAKVLTTEKAREKMQGYEGQRLAAQRLGRLLGVEAVITGTVTEYRYVYGAGEQPTVSVTVRLVSSGEGKVLWNKSYSSSGNLSWIRETTLGEVSREICSKISTDLRRAFK